MSTIHRPFSAFRQLSHPRVRVRLKPPGSYLASGFKDQTLSRLESRLQTDEEAREDAIPNAGFLCSQFTPGLSAWGDEEGV